MSGGIETPYEQGSDEEKLLQCSSRSYKDTIPSLLKAFQKKFQETLDKKQILCYNKDVPRG